MRLQKKLFISLGVLFIFALASSLCSAQDVQTYSTDNQGRPIPKNSSPGGGNDSLKLRDKYEDSITISYIMYDSSMIHGLDSAVNDFNSRLQKPYTYNDLGNIGSPAKSLLFNPYMKPGFDEGIHSMDLYKYTIENTKYYTSSRPYSVIGYMLGGKGEQYIDLLHTQNRSRNVNFAFEYRLLNAPGAFKNQNDANSNLRVNLSAHSTNRRYSSNFIFIRNSLKAATNGGLVNQNDLNNLSLGGPYEVSTRLGSSNLGSSNPFNATVTTGNLFTNLDLYLRQSYDFGQKDSLVKDSVTYHLFYPRLRLEHTIRYSTSDYRYQDNNPISSDYLTYYNLIVPTDTISYRDRWKELNNEFAIYTYPDKKNANQYLKLFADLQILNGQLGTQYKQTYNNIMAGVEYRNRTKNQKWDVEAAGTLFVAGSYSGDYNGHINLKRVIGDNIGSLKIGFENVNRTPSFIYNSASSSGFNFDTSAQISLKAHSDFPVIGVNDLKKENISKAFAEIYLPSIRLKLVGNYFLYNNYTYFDDFFTANQSSTAFNLLQIGAEKETKLGKLFHWYLEGYIQKKAGSTPINLPLLLIRNRIALEGNFFNNLYIATGFDIRYVSDYKPDLYSPFTGQFFYQNQSTIHNLPDISFYTNFRIKRFKFFGELANLNTLSTSGKKIGFNHYNYLAPNYPTLGLWIRLGVWWNFIN